MKEEEESQFLFTWRIKKFNFFGKLYCECLSSPVFKVDSLDNSEWKIFLYPRTISEDLECRLEHLSNSKKENIAVNFRFQLASSNGVVLKTSNTFCQTFQEGTFSEVCRLTELYNLVKEVLKYPEDTLIFRCYMSHNSGSMSITGCEVETDISCHAPSFIWNFKFTDADDWSVNKQIKSDNIPMDVAFKYKHDKIDVELISSHDDDWTHHFTCDIELINSIGNQVTCGEGDYEFNNENRIWKFPSFISKQHLEQAQCFVRQELRVKFCIIRLYSFNSKINYCLNDLDSTMNKTVVPSTSSETDCLQYYSQYHFQNLSYDNKSTDITLRLDNEVFHVHKSLLSEQSPVFTEMFGQNMKKNDAGFINVNDVEAGIIKYFLQYFYDGKLNEMDVEVALDLLLAAERYQVLTLVEKCSKYVEKNLSCSNVCRVLFTADIINHERLKSCAVDYIILNSSKILSTPEWLYWIERSLHLATEILMKLSKKLDSVLKHDQI